MQEGEEKGTMTKEQVINKIKENYWKNPQLPSEKFWDSLGKRELIECFLRSDITHIFNINNSP